MPTERWNLVIIKADGRHNVPALTGADHYNDDYWAVVNENAEPDIFGNQEVICDNAQYYAAPVSLEHARLISAAPDLLAALQELSGWVNRAIVTEFTERKPMPDNCRKALEVSAFAIAKATGNE